MSGPRVTMVLGLGMIAVAVQLAISGLPMVQWFGYSVFGNVLAMVGYMLARDREKLEQEEDAE